MLERKYIIPLRREWLKVPKYQRSRKAVVAIGKFVARHMKSTMVKIGENLNEYVWKNGMKNPPAKVEVNCLKEDGGKCYVELQGFPVKKPVAEEKKKEEKKEEVKAMEEKGVAEEETKKSIEGAGEHHKQEKALEKMKAHQKKETMKSKESQVIGRTQKNT